ncbi:ABC-2 type transport system permease protein [Saccharicrinis carchari]|uniref:ABC-2 type transport system permease protein n=1 Tax=Saccharicrinis carchari TaxID=1168039 RepID=A0A521E7E6_SACCC|nr:ABC transporter permease subunit [Saccharicrinis carchari]SMO79873.1 ABC-2 type transport system permease protein [Saccharicrinis carchari]
MKQIWIITKSELKGYFDSLMAYILIVVFLGLSGFFTWLYGNNDVFYINQATLQPFFGVAYWTLFIFIPALTMKQIAEEYKTGTIELLLTKPISDWQVVTAKFLATFLLIAISLALTLPYYLSIASIGPIDHGSVLTGYLGLLLMSAAYISIGIFASSITSNQIVAFLLALIIGVFFQILFGITSTAFSGTIGDVLAYMDMQYHYRSIIRGVIDSKNIIYFASIVLVGLMASELSLVKRNIN